MTSHEEDCYRRLMAWLANKDRWRCGECEHFLTSSSNRIKLEGIP